MISSTSFTYRQGGPLVVALAAIASLALGACGGSNDTTATTTPAVTSTTPTTSSTTPSSTTTTSTDASSSSDLRQTFDTALRKNLIETQGLTQQQADCVLNELHNTLQDSQLQATVSGQAPKAVTKAAFQAGIKCASP
jgi:hypothetical protein